MGVFVLGGEVGGLILGGGGGGWGDRAKKVSSF